VPAARPATLMLWLVVNVVLVDVLEPYAVVVP
jgi:hypothetical protein